MTWPGFHLFGLPLYFYNPCSFPDCHTHDVVMNPWAQEFLVIMEDVWLFELYGSQQPPIGASLKDKSNNSFQDEIILFGLADISLMSFPSAMDFFSGDEPVKKKKKRWWHQAKD